MKSCTFVFVVLAFVIEIPQRDARLIVLHTANFRSNFVSERTGQNTTRYGIARMMAYIKKQQQLDINSTIYIDAMDWAEGSVLYSYYKMKVLKTFVHMLPVDVLTIGEAEMTQGSKSERYKNFEQYILDICNKTIVCSNMDIPADHNLFNCIHKYAIIQKGKYRIGVLSYLEEALVVSPFGGIKIRSVSVVDDVVTKLHEAKEKVDLFLMVGHASKELLERTSIRPITKFVIGAHGDVLFYNGDPPSGDPVMGKYPEIPRLSRIPLFYAGSYGKYVGRIVLDFLPNRTIIFSGNPVHMGEDVEEDQQVLEVLEEYKQGVDKKLLKGLGRCRGRLDVHCFRQECTFGNLIADSLIDYKASMYDGRYWSDTPIAFVNAGSIKSNIYALVLQNRTITEANLMAALPYDNNLVTVIMNGSVLRSVMEHSVHDLTSRGQMAFLQVSGLRVTYDLSQPHNRRASFRVRCGKCIVPEYLDYKESETYTVVTTNYLAEGGDGYAMIRDDYMEMNSERVTVKNVVKEYIKYYRIIQTCMDERITVKQKPEHRTHKQRSSKGILVAHPINFRFYYYLCIAYVLLKLNY